MGLAFALLAGVGGTDHVHEFGLQGLGDAFHVVDADVPFTAFNGADVVTVQVGSFSEFFLGQGLRLPQVFEGVGEALPGAGRHRSTMWSGDPCGYTR